MCRLYRQEHDSLWDLGRSSSELDIKPSSPVSLFAMRDEAISTDLELSGRLGSPPQPVREASVVSILQWHETPSTGHKDRNQCFFHITREWRNLRLTLITWNGLPLGETPWFWATTAVVSFTEGEKESHWTQLPWVPTAFETVSQVWPDLAWFSWGWRCKRRMAYSRTPLSGGPERMVGPDVEVVFYRAGSTHLACFYNTPLASRLANQCSIWPRHKQQLPPATHKQRIEVANSPNPLPQC